MKQRILGSLSTGLGEAFTAQIFGLERVCLSILSSKSHSTITINLNDMNFLVESMQKQLKEVDEELAADYRIENGEDVEVKVEGREIYIRHKRANDAPFRVLYKDESIWDGKLHKSC